MPIYGIRASFLRHTHTYSLNAGHVTSLCGVSALNTG